MSNKDTKMLEEHTEGFSPELMADRAVNMLRIQKGFFGGFQVDLYEHGLQTATRAEKDGASEELIVCGLLHDIGELLSPTNHGEIPASILKPYISPESLFILQHHEIFQGYYYVEHFGLNKNIRDQFKESPYFQATVDFCEKYDAPSFDPNYKSYPLEHFIPMVLNIFSRPPFQLYKDRA